MHTEITDLLSLYRDGDLHADERARVEAHLATCEPCRAVLADLDFIVKRAGSLEPLQPPRDLWPGIAARIGADTMPAGGSGSAGTLPTGDDVVPIARERRVRRVFTFTVPQLAAAAIVLALAAAGAARMLPQRGAPVTPAVTAAASDAGGALQLAAHVERSYESSIRHLEETLAEADDVLDPATVAVLRQSLAIIDAAIGDARAALEADPANEYLTRHLDSTMRRKVDLLREANRLVART